MGGSAFNAFKTLAPIEWSPRLYITLVRGLPGTRKLHRRTLEAMRLRRCHRTVAHRNTPSLLGMLNQVKRLVAVETEAMYDARKQEEEENRALRPPLVVSHSPPANGSCSSGVTSNSDAAQLAESFAETKCPTKVVGVPVTLYGDLKNQ